MPVYFNAKSIIDASMPGSLERSAMVKTPDTSGSVEVLIPESAYQEIFTSMASIAGGLGGVSAEMNIMNRNDLVRGLDSGTETYATLVIVRAGELTPDVGDTFEDFILQSANEATQEKYQLVETFGETVGFFYGSRPKIYQYSGVLVNSEQYPWRDNWKEYYETRLRGSQLVRQNKRAYLTYDFVLREGYILSFNMTQSSAYPNSLDFNFTMFITKEVNLNPDVQAIANENNNLFFADNEVQDEYELPYEPPYPILDTVTVNVEEAADGYKVKMGDKANASQNGTPKDALAGSWYKGTPVGDVPAASGLA